MFSTSPRTLHGSASTVQSLRTLRGSKQSGLISCVCRAHGRRATQFRPCIDIHQGAVKQIVGGSLKDLGRHADAGDLPKENFVSDKPSSYYADIYAVDKVEGGHVIMLGADAASERSAEEALKAWPKGMQLGGGVNKSNAAKWLDLGASHVIVTSFVFADGKLHEENLQALVDLVGKKQLVLDLSCRKKADGHYYVVTDRWQKFSDVRVDKATLVKLAASCDEFLVHGVDVEGLQLGIDLELVQLLGQFSPIPVTYAGGARTLDDLKLVQKASAGKVDVTVGSALDIFGGQLKYADVLSWNKEQALLAKEVKVESPETCTLHFA